MAGSGAGPIEVKTTLSEVQFNTMLKFCEALGVTQAGFIRQAVIEDMARKHALVEQLADLFEIPETGREQP